jgi:hypothetical protein
MKITLHIADEHAPMLIQLLGTLLAKTSPVEANPDPAPGHPELPLQDEAELRWGIAGELEETDPTRRDLPLPDGLPELPPLPEGKTRWVYRGRFDELRIPTYGRIVRYFESHAWWETSEFSTILHHIEAI